MRPEHYLPSAWLGHEQFLYWLIGATRPQTIVELGVHYGFSYFTACHAVKYWNTGSRCFGIDTWTGDEHAGFYGEHVFDIVSAINEADYKDVSTLVRSSFDDAARQFKATSINLLHIDGRHGYDDVKHDFETWKPKLFPGATVLFHDIAVEKDGFGVKQFWNEIRDEYQSFQFDHAHGLGVLTFR